MIFVNDPTGQTLYHDPSWRDLTGQTVAQALGTGWLTRIHADERAMVEDTHFQAMEAQFEYAMQYRLLGPDDRAKWVYISAKASMGPPDRTFIGFLGSLMTVPEAEAETARPFRIIRRNPEEATDGPLDACARSRRGGLHDDEIGRVEAGASAPLKDRVAAAIASSRQARLQIGTTCAYRTRVTLDMVLLELSKELARLNR